MKHGCNANYNVGPVQEVNEMNADETALPEDAPLLVAQDFDNTFVDRNARLLMHSLCYANRDIAAGSEIMNNYLNYADSLDEWKRAVSELREQCAANEEQATAEA